MFSKFTLRGWANGRNEQEVKKTPLKKIQSCKKTPLWFKVTWLFLWCKKWTKKTLAIDIHYPHIIDSFETVLVNLNTGFGFGTKSVINFNWMNEKYFRSQLDLCTMVLSYKRLARYRSLTLEEMVDAVEGLICS